MAGDDAAQAAEVRFISSQCASLCLTAEQILLDSHEACAIPCVHPRSAGERGACSGRASRLATRC